MAEQARKLHLQMINIRRVLIDLKPEDSMAAAKMLLIQVTLRETFVNFILRPDAPEFLAGKNPHDFIFYPEENDLTRWGVYWIAGGQTEKRWEYHTYSLGEEWEPAVNWCKRISGENTIDTTQSVFDALNNFCGTPESPLMKALEERTKRMIVKLRSRLKHDHPISILINDDNRRYGLNSWPFGARLNAKIDGNWQQTNLFWIRVKNLGVNDGSVVTGELDARNYTFFYLEDPRLIDIEHMLNPHGQSTSDAGNSFFEIITVPIVESVVLNPFPLPEGAETLSFRVKVLSMMPSSIILKHGPHWHQCCHGAPNIELAELERNFESLFGTTRYLYEATRDFNRKLVLTKDVEEARPNKDLYNMHDLKWADMMVDGGRKSERGGGTETYSYSELDAYANKMGLADIFAVISGHQDLVNFGFVMGVANFGSEASHRSGLFIHPDEERNPYKKQLFVMDMSQLTNSSHKLCSHGQFGPRFVVTSSALYSKKSDVKNDQDKTLVRVCWLYKHKEDMYILLDDPKTPSPEDALDYEPELLDYCKMSYIVDYVIHTLRYKPYDYNGPLEGYSTRLFSKSYCDVIFEKAYRKYAEYTKEHVVYYQRVDADEKNAHIVFLGDLHSSIYSLCKMLKWCQEQGFFEDDEFALKEDHYIILLGDLVDRGPFGVDILVIVFKMMLRSKGKFLVCNGNHETEPIYNQYGLRDEIDREYRNPYSNPNGEIDGGGGDGGGGEGGGGMGGSGEGGGDGGGGGEGGGEGGGANHEPMDTT